MSIRTIPQITALALVLCSPLAHAQTVVTPAGTAQSAPAAAKMADTISVNLAVAANPAVPTSRTVAVSLIPPTAMRLPAPANNALADQFVIVGADLNDAAVAKAVEPCDAAVIVQSQFCVAVDE